LPIVVGVRFKRAGKIYYFDPAGLELKRQEAVVVETARGLELGEVATTNREVSEEGIVSPLKRVVRKATASDLQQSQRNQVREKDALDVCRRKVQEHGLDMHLVDAEYSFDASKIVFCFTADGRVDFRELVKDLASAFRMRIELRQIGVRDEAKFLGGLGTCGRELCCCSFLDEFEPVSIRMAKDQHLSLNPSKISGVCGRLMCCLRYECQHYGGARAHLPEVGARVVTLDGEGRVVCVNALKNSVSVELDNRVLKEFPVEEVDEKRNAAGKP